jgi:hypothetical protein
MTPRRWVALWCVVILVAAHAVLMAALTGSPVPILVATLLTSLGINTLMLRHRDLE